MEFSKINQGIEFQITTETIFYGIAFWIHTILGIYGFFLSWIILTLVSRQMVRTGIFSLKKLAHSIAVSTPIGVLAAASAQDAWGYSQNICALIGCFVAIGAQQILDGNWMPKLIDAIIEKIKNAGT